MTDPWIAVAVAAALLLVFALALLVPRRPRMVRAPVTDAKLDGLHQRLDAVEKKQNQTDHDLRGIRMSLGTFPTKDSVHALELKVLETSGKVDGISTQLTANSSSLGRIEDFLMKSTAEAIASKIVEGQK